MNVTGRIKKLTKEDFINFQEHYIETVKSLEKLYEMFDSKSKPNCDNSICTRIMFMS